LLIRARLNQVNQVVALRVQITIQGASQVRTFLINALLLRVTVNAVGLGVTAHLMVNV